MSPLTGRGGIDLDTARFVMAKIYPIIVPDQVSRLELSHRL